MNSGNSGNSANSGVSYYTPPNAPSVDDVLNALDAGLITKAQAAAKVKVILGVVEEKKK